MTRYLLAWIPMVMIAIGNGVFRQAWLLPRYGDLHARQLSTLMLLGLFAIYIGAVVRLWPLASGRQAGTIGLSWLALTLLFEFALGRFVSHLSWQEMMGEYNVAAGRLWVLVPIWVAIAPYVFHTVHRRRFSS